MKRKIKKQLKTMLLVMASLLVLAGCTANTSETISTTEEVEEVETEIVTELVEEETKIIFTDKEIKEENLVEDYNGPYHIVINRATNVVTVYALEGEGEQAPVVKRMLCSVGKGGTDEDGDSNDTPLGRFEIYERYRWRPLFGNVEGQYAIRFNGHILFHSVPYKSQDESTLKPGEYNKLGEPASLGCVRLAVADAKWIYDNCPDGTVVEVIEDLDRIEVKPLGIKVSDESEYAGWDPTDPNENNPWLGKLPEIKNVKDIEIVKGSSKEVLMTVLNEVYGTEGEEEFRLEAFIENIDTIDLNTVGEYEIIYGTTGSHKATVYERATVNVVEEIKE